MAKVAEWRRSFRHFRHSATCCFYTLCTVFCFQKGYRTLTEGSRALSKGFYFTSIARVRFCGCQYLWQILQIATRHLSPRIHLPMPMPNIKLISFILQKNTKKRIFCTFYLHSSKKYTTFAPHSVKGSR